MSTTTGPKSTGEQTTGSPVWCRKCQRRKTPGTGDRRTDAATAHRDVLGATIPRGDDYGIGEQRNVVARGNLRWRLPGTGQHSCSPSQRGNGVSVHSAQVHGASSGSVHAANGNASANRPRTGHKVLVVLRSLVREQHLLVRLFR